ncbi:MULTISPECIES: hypothetical protein [Bacillus cereus group]|uniref:hypothetical protein n=1 Tax=Bacillus cereus group TaxID=86661 RepID=UPI002E1B6B8E|nr:hypothetical protein [Bacillus proteolyticus]
MSKFKIKKNKCLTNLSKCNIKPPSKPPRLPKGFDNNRLPNGYDLNDIIPIDDLKQVGPDEIFRSTDTQLQVLIQSNVVGDNGTELLQKIDQAKEDLKDIQDPNKMVKKWRAIVLGKAEEAAMAYLEEETKKYETSIYQIAPLVLLEMSKMTVNAEIFLYISDPNEDTGGLSKTGQFEKISYAVLRAEFQFDVTNPFDINQVKDAIESARFKILQDSIKEQLTEKFEKEQQKLIIDVVEHQFGDAFEIFKNFQENLNLFT